MSLHDEIKLSDYKIMSKSIYMKELNDFEVRLKASNEIFITKENAAHFLVTLFDIQTFTLCSDIEGYLGGESDKINVGSIIEILLINRIALNTYRNLYKLSSLLNITQELIFKLMKDLASEVTPQMLEERTKLYSKELHDVSQIEGRIPNLLLYHIYTSPLPQEINYMGKSSNDMKQYFNFFRSHAFNCAHLKAAFKHYDSIKKFFLDKPDDSIPLILFESICKDLFNYGTVELPLKPKTTTSDPPTKYEFLQYVTTLTKYYLEQFPYSKKSDETIVNFQDFL